MIQARTVPVQQKRDEKSSSSSSDGEGFLERNVRRGIRLAEIAGNASLMTFSALDTATSLTLDAMVALNNLMRQQNNEEEPEDASAETGRSPLNAFQAETSRGYRDEDNDNEEEYDDEEEYEE